ncbi:uncharacterized protein LOC127358059 [Dicentrarchus labrax]|uniref:uncharacterized protein LOC127358059 n=1 Tax=Dicentrarchus labrax TaxID=13489 RepID=UPI0021F6649D|nr:uncharacterized protein LOC127358059 [Dicentrarchus labrax]
MKTLVLYIPEDRIEAEPATELDCSDLDICLQRPESPPITLGGARSLSPVATILHEKEEDECMPLPQEEEAQQEEPLQELQNLQQTWQNSIQTEELEGFKDIAGFAEEMMEELGDPRPEKSIRRRFLNWLNEGLEARMMKKIARTYQRELEEGDRYYRSSYMAPPLMTRAQRERQKREELIQLDNQRQSINKRLDAHWEAKRRQKEAQRVEEEERYEKWMVGHGWSAPDSPPEAPKKRMSKWEKRFLNVKEVFSFRTNRIHPQLLPDPVDTE